MQPVTWTPPPPAPQKSYATAPQPMRIAAGLTVAQILVGGALGFLAMDALVGSVEAPPDASPALVGGLARAALVVGTVFSLALNGLLYYFAFAGKQVAHVVLLVLAGLSAVSSLVGLVGPGAGSPRAGGAIPGTMGTVANGLSLATAGAVLFLLTRPHVLAYVRKAPVDPASAPPPYAP